MEQGINYESDYLVINRDTQGNFKSFRWYPASIKTDEELKKRIVEWNEEQKALEDGLQAEQITDRFIRQICAYRHSASQPVIQDQAGVKDSIVDVLDYLENAVSALEELKRNL